MNTVRACGCVRVRYTTPEMKLFAWLCIGCWPPVSSTFTHISFSDHPRCSPNISAPNSGKQRSQNARRLDQEWIVARPQQRRVHEIARRVVGLITLRR